MKKVPKYKALRLFVVAVILYFMLIWPILVMLFITNSPKIVGFQSSDTTINNNIDTVKLKQEITKSLDSIQIKDSLIQANLKEGTGSANKKKGGLHIDFSKKGSEENVVGNKTLLNYCFLISFIIGFIFCLPYKIYFRRKRKGRNIPPKVVLFCRKTILHSPLIMALIIALPFVVHNIDLIYRLFISNMPIEAFQRKMSVEYWAIFLLSGLLTVVFVFFWQKHNMQILYLEHIFSREELKKRIFKSKSGKIRNRLVLTSFLTTLLPLSIVVAYLLMSLTSLSDIGLYEPTQGEFKVVFGEYYDIIKNGNVNTLIHEANFYYINVVDTMLLFGGIVAGILVTVVYLLFFVRWTNSDIINPVNELLINMQKTTRGQLDNYSLVRTNDELGNLSENYNIMTSKLYEYISHIGRMNAELEQKVKERTAEIQAQKEEIEAQRDEVESQRDEIEMQRDYVIEQRDLIILQKKAITDSIEYAANIQSAILPPARELDIIFPEYFVYYRPRDIVSGDFYWAHKINKKGQNKVIVIAADSTGHGVPGAIMSMLGITLLKEIVVKKGIFNPSEILDNLKENVVNSLHQADDSGKSKDGIDISVCLIDFDNKKLEYAGAYNPIYLVRKVNSENLGHNRTVLDKIIYENYDSKLLIEIKADKNPIGLSHKTEKKYSLHTLDLEVGDVLYMFSDGYADQFGGEKRLKYLYSRFKMFLANIPSEPLNKQYHEIDKELTKWRGNERQVDDILVMGIKIS
jgi:serine phosphatase RsbU (regulator of sigma subunit)